MYELAIFMTVRCKPGKRAELHALWDEHLRPRAEQNDDQPRYVYALDSADPEVIRIMEVYATKAALESNAGAEWFAEYMSRVFPLVDGEPEYHTAEPVWVT